MYIVDVHKVYIKYTRMYTKQSSVHSTTNRRHIDTFIYITKRKERKTSFSDGVLRTRGYMKKKATIN